MNFVFLGGWRTEKGGPDGPCIGWSLVEPPRRKEHIYDRAMREKELLQAWQSNLGRFLPMFQKSLAKGAWAPQQGLIGSDSP